MTDHEKLSAFQALCGVIDGTPVKHDGPGLLSDVAIRLRDEAAGVKRGATPFDKIEAMRKNAGSDAHPPGGIDGKRRPHVHRPVYFGTPTEHNRKLLEGAIRCLTQFIERNEANPNVGRLMYHTVKIQEYAEAQESSPEKTDCPCVGGHEPQGPHGKAPGR